MHVARKLVRMDTYSLVRLNVFRTSRENRNECMAVIEYGPQDDAKIVVSSGFYEAGPEIPEPAVWTAGIRHLLRRMESNYRERNEKLERQIRSRRDEQRQLLRDYYHSYQFLMQDLEDPRTCDLKLEQKLDFLGTFE